MAKMAHLRFRWRTVFMKSRSRAALVAAVFALSFTIQAAGASSPASAPAGGPGSITPEELKDWLSYIASDELEGRQVFTEGLGLAASYIADHLKQWGVKPAGDAGTYFQEVKVIGYTVKSQSSVTVTVNGESRTFKDGEGMTFARNQGGNQTVTSSDVVFVGYGLSRDSH